MKKLATTLLCAGLGLVLTACPNDDAKKAAPQASPSGPAGSSSASPAGSGASSASAASSASTGAAKATSPGSAQTFKGTYDAKAAELTLPKDVKWKGDDVGQDGIGEGTLEITIDADGVLRGTSKGALGEAFLTGTSKDQIASGWMLRKTSGDLGFSGSFYASIDGKDLKGVLRASRGNAGALREAAFTLKRAE